MGRGPSGSLVIRSIVVCLVYLVLPWFPLVPSVASQCLLRGAGLWQVLVLVLSGCPGVSVRRVESQAHGHTEASWTGILVTESLFLTLLAHPNPNKVLT